MSNIKEQMDASMEFTRSVKLMGYEATKEILDAVNKAVLAGAKPEIIVDLIDTLTKFKKA